MQTLFSKETNDGWKKWAGVSPSVEEQSIMGSYSIRKRGNRYRSTESVGVPSGIRQSHAKWQTGQSVLMTCKLRLKPPVVRLYYYDKRKVVWANSGKGSGMVQEGREGDCSGEESVVTWGQWQCYPNPRQIRNHGLSGKLEFRGIQYRGLLALWPSSLKCTLWQSSCDVFQRLTKRVLLQRRLSLEMSRLECWSPVLTPWLQRTTSLPVGKDPLEGVE